MDRIGRQAGGGSVRRTLNKYLVISTTHSKTLLSTHRITHKRHPIFRGPFTRDKSVTGWSRRFTLSICAHREAGISGNKGRIASIGPHQGWRFARASCRRLNPDNAGLGVTDQRITKRSFCFGGSARSWRWRWAKGLSHRGQS